VLFRREGIYSCPTCGTNLKLPFMAKKGGELADFETVAYSYGKSSPFILPPA